MDEVIAAITRRELGKPPKQVVEVAEGLLHETYLLSCDGEEYVLQFTSDADDDREDSLRRGLGWYVALQDSGIPVPGVVTENVAVFDGREYVLVERLPGETGERDVSPEKVRDAGRHLARIHDAWTFDSAGWIRFEGREPTVQEFQEGSLKRRILRDLAEGVRILQDGGLVTAGRAVEGLFDRFEDGLHEGFRPVLCHDDYSPDNVLFGDGEVTGILDFDRAYAGHGQRDLAKAANGFWMHDPCSDWDVRATFYEGYREVRELEDSFERNEPFNRVETLAETVAGLLEMGELSEYEREFYAERILDAIERAGEVES